MLTISGLLATGGEDGIADIAHGEGGGCAIGEVHLELLLYGQGQHQHRQGIDAQFAHQLRLEIGLAQVRMGTNHGKDFLQSFENFFPGHTRATFILPVRLKSSVRTVTLIIRCVEGSVALILATSAFI